MIFAIHGYQKWISFWIPCQCRFEPSCSHYAEEAYRVRGFWVGTALTIWRILRCQPFCRGGYDPVPLPKERHKRDSAIKDRLDKSNEIR